MTILNDLYDYGVSIYQNDDYFKFSLDSILLAEFVKLQNNFSVLDLCTGNAPVPLILATKNNTLDIDGLEIQTEIFELASKSVKYNNFNDRINIYNIDANMYDAEKKYDIITCNPPYFKKNDGKLINSNPIKAIARHEIAITLKNIINIARNNLKETGTFYMVNRNERFLETVELLHKNKFGIRDVVFINTNNESKSTFFLIEASKYKKDDLKIFTINIKDLKTYKNIFGR